VDIATQHIETRRGGYLAYKMPTPGLLDPRLD